MFSPYYAWSGRRDPVNHCAVNVALYGKQHARWAMTERGRDSVARSQSQLRIGPSSFCWHGGALKIDLDEIGAPLPKRVRGTIRVTPTGLTGRCFELDAAGHHIWQPIAPRARIEVRLERPDLHWNGTAYLDSNFGAEPLETGFRRWSWSRSHLARDAAVLYDVERRDGTQVALALRFGPNGDVTPMTPPPRVTLKPTAWRIARDTRADAGHVPHVARTFEDTPFYARSLIKSRLWGQNAELFHESLSLDRFAAPVVRAMLPFRMPRRVF